MPWLPNKSPGFQRMPQICSCLGMPPAALPMLRLLQPTPGCPNQRPAVPQPRPSCSKNVGSRPGSLLRSWRNASRRLQPHSLPTQLSHQTTTDPVHQCSYFSGQQVDRLMPRLLDPQISSTCMPVTMPVGTPRGLLTSAPDQCPGCSNSSPDDSPQETTGTGLQQELLTKSPVNSLIGCQTAYVYCGERKNHSASPLAVHTIMEVCRGWKISNTLLDSRRVARFGQAADRCDFAKGVLVGTFEVTDRSATYKLFEAYESNDFHLR
jgi:hypothetical protein